eukprot:CAMPEP_0176073080 /NCGR_PEP_ID=MMETSP0120_2-20121206/36514_1 /TAXON_ID=160619 /ORGANISM="Kryptoperidinium foliaceum, Strain CCMP 1326" /LENGTH=49 /DNA_ID=CAMNT_0017406761 /DNA_START=485 /DNA_END=634 /DNA_ORIENTATION=-
MSISAITCAFGGGSDLDRRSCICLGAKPEHPDKIKKKEAALKTSIMQIE